MTVIIPAVMIAMSAPESGFGFAAAEIALSKKCMKNAEAHGRHSNEHNVVKD